MEATCLSRRRSRDEDMDVSKGKMTVQEVGKLGDLRVHELIEEGKENEEE